MYEGDHAGVGTIKIFSFRQRLARSGSFFFFVPSDAWGLVAALAPCKYTQQMFSAIVGTCKIVGFVVVQYPGLPCSADEHH